MTNILRKKISLSTGIPPTIQNAEQFWCELCDATDVWISLGLEIPAESVVVGRKVLTGEEAGDEGDEGDISFVMPPVADFGLCGVSFSRKLALTLAARRMHQNVASLEDTSGLFLSLISEDPGMLLRESVSAHLEGRQYDFKKGIDVDLSFRQAELKPLGRYAQVEIEMRFGDLVERVRLLFGFDVLKDYLTLRSSNLEGSSDTLGLKNHRLINSSLQKSDIRIDAVLERIQMTLGACSRLKVGQTLPLLHADQGSISIAVETVSGSTDISRGELGIWKQKRAIKLSAPISENFVRDLAPL